eukprot:CAMPEP_0177396164 /NCGR_PEP_ID=MMETSP0368-20130122/56556_1 /TAXON_ID=447022 ORGANISM="Scrippsiella hangoei-like, Strain SHHI-4" /NCGR_SAMPLE_ID=MMETSP0368 /ASSEMBLY_ACC=CAM_ASM_000363 /LENGTH=43 /DNA_ID= /DNA_START= /DNA_END= /DNA_ORIENTATION=
MSFEPLGGVSDTAPRSWSSRALATGIAGVDELLERAFLTGLWK